MALTSRHTASRFKERATFAYAYVLLLIVVELVFYLFSQDLAGFIDRNTVDTVTYEISYVIVLMINFVVVAVILYKLVKNLKFVGKVLLDVERKAGVLDKPKRASMKFQKAFIRMNNWVLVIVVTFLIVLLVPNEAGLLEHAVSMLGGIGAIGIFYAYRHMTTGSFGKTR
jgi:hypothetical protein